jgi:hypothetical protein
VYNALAGDMGSEIGPDGLHPTVQGYAKIADVLFEATRHTLELILTTAARGSPAARQRRQ